MNRAVCIPVSLEVQADVPVAAACPVLAEMLLEMEACTSEAASGITGCRKITVKLPNFSGSVQICESPGEACMLHIVGTYTVPMETMNPDLDVAGMQHCAGVRLQRTIESLAKDLAQRARVHA